MLTFPFCDQQEGHGEEAGLAILLPNPQASPCEMVHQYGLLWTCAILLCFVFRQNNAPPHPLYFFLFGLGAVLPGDEREMSVIAC